MGTRLNKQAYQKLIAENIAEIEKYMPEHSLEKVHTIDVLKWSVREIYGEDDENRNPYACFGNQRPHPMDFEDKEEYELRIIKYMEWEVKNNPIIIKK